MEGKWISSDYPPLVNREKQILNVQLFMGESAGHVKHVKAQNNCLKLGSGS